MSAWRVEEAAGGLRLAEVRRRALDSEALTWADLLYRRLDAVRVYVLYFPSRFDLPVDAGVRAALEAFGRATGPATSANTWDPADPEFGRALAFFGLEAPPALVLLAGHLVGEPTRPARDTADLYSVAIADAAVLGDRERLAAAVNAAHELLLRGDRREIARYLRARDAAGLLAALGRLGAHLRDGILKLKPKLGLPGGVSLQLGG